MSDDQPSETDPLENEETFCDFVAKKTGKDDPETKKKCEEILQETGGSDETFKRLADLTGVTEQKIISLTVEACPTCSANDPVAEKKEEKKE